MGNNAETQQPAEPPKSEAQPPVETTGESLIGEGMLVGGATAVAYLFAFAYEWIYARYFGIPTELIEINILTVLFVVAALVGFVSFIYPYLNFISIMPNIVHPSIAAKLTGVLFLAVITVIVPLLLLGFTSWDLLIHPIIGLVMAVVLNFILPLIFHREQGGLVKRFEAQAELDKTTTFTSLEDTLSKSAPAFVSIFILILMGGHLSIVFGRSEAVFRRNFLVTNTKPERVVLRVYGDKMICAPFDREKKEVQKSFALIKVGDDTSLTLTLEEIGPLKPVNSKPQSTPQTAIPEPSSANTPAEVATPQVIATPSEPVVPSVTPTPDQSTNN